MSFHRGVSRDAFGNSVSGASVTVYESGTTTAASIYSDGIFSASKSNPFTTGDDGVYEFHADPGLYDIQIAKAGFTTTTLEDTIVGQVFLYASGASGGAWAQATATVEYLTLNDAPAITWSIHEGTDFTIDADDGIVWGADLDVMMDIEVRARLINTTGASSTVQLGCVGTTDGVAPYSFITEDIQTKTGGASEVINLNWRGVVALATNGTIKPFLYHTEGAPNTLQIQQLLIFVRGIS